MGFIINQDKITKEIAEELQSVCPFGALEITDGGSIVNEEKCMGGGVCVSHCPQDALSLLRDLTKGEPLEIHALMEDALRAS